MVPPLAVSELAVASVVIAVAALLFTVGSFWYMNVRRGHLRVPVPHGYAIVANEALLLLRLPLAIYNDGARAIIVRDLRIWFSEDETQQVLPSPWRTMRSSLRPQPDDLVDFANSFPVRGREAVTVIAEFGGPLPGFSIGPGSYWVRVQAIDDGSDKWYDLVAFTLYVTAEEDTLGQYIAHRNLGPDDEELARAKRSLERLLEHLKSVAENSTDPSTTT